jgi:hypothetical protein
MKRLTTMRPTCHNEQECNIYSPLSSIFMASGIPLNTAWVLECLTLEDFVSLNFAGAMKLFDHIGVMTTYTQTISWFSFDVLNVPVRLKA